MVSNNVIVVILALSFLLILFSIVMWVSGDSISPDFRTEGDSGGDLNGNVGLTIHRGIEDVSNGGE